MPRKTKKAPKTKSNGIRWTAARRKAHGAKIQAARRMLKVPASSWTPPGSVIGTSPEMADLTKLTPFINGPKQPSITEAIRTKVRAILPEIIDQELAALLKP